MTTIGWIQILLYCAIIVALTPVLGAYMTRCTEQEHISMPPSK
jgi:K+-transporting ATPase ATPase A chain